MRAGLAIVEEVRGVEGVSARAANPLSVRVGIHTGATVIGRGAGDALDVFGESPNIAARVQALAEHDQVLMTAATHRLVSGLFIVEAKGEQALKGVCEPVGLYRAVRASGVRGRLALARTLTPFVGRERELELLLERWEMAREGDGQVVTIAGEAGIGKSRLVQQFRSAISATPHSWVEVNGSPLFTATPFHPIAEMLRQFFGSAGASVELATIERTMDVLGLARQETVPVLAPLLGVAVPPGYLEMALTPDQERRKLFAALVALVQRSAAMQPAVLVGEDVHWVDPSTLELIGLLCEQAAGAPMLLVHTARPEFRAPWPLRSHHAQLTLSRLNRSHVRAMVRQVVAETTVADDVVEAVVARTDGVPLFVEELTRSVVEGDRSVTTIPATLQDTLMARLDRLGEAREVIQIASVIGREFGYDLVRRLCDGQRSEAWLDAALGKLAAADLVQVRGLAPDATYTFRHALIQEAAYESLLKSRRRELHAQVANALGDASHEVKARHLAAAGDVEAAITAWEHAGHQALLRSAFREAETHLGEALRLLGTQPDSPQRAERELALRIPYNNALLVSRGYSAPESAESSERTRILCEALGDDEKILNALRPAWTVALNAGRTRVALELAERMVELAARTDRDTWRRCWAYACRGVAQYQVGAFAEAQADLDQAIDRYVAERFINEALDPRIVVFTYAALTAWHRGRRETARRLMSKIVAAAEVGGRPLERGWVRIFQLIFAAYDETPNTARQLAQELSRLGSELAFPFLVANGQFFTGYVMAVADGEVDGVRLMRSGLSELISSGNRASLCWYMRVLGHAESHVGDRDGALATFDAALTEVGDDRVHRPEVLFSRAQCLARHAADAATVETAFRTALDDANAIDALSFALRAASGLARVLLETGRRDEARAVLAPIYARFTEGLGDADLVEAKTLLDELG